jgi:hypothetical protein
MAILCWAAKNSLRGTLVVSYLPPMLLTPAVVNLVNLELQTSSRMSKFEMALW